MNNIFAKYMIINLYNIFCKNMNPIDLTKISHYDFRELFVKTMETMAEEQKESEQKSYTAYQPNNEELINFNFMATSKYDFWLKLYEKSKEPDSVITDMVYSYTKIQEIIYHNINIKKYYYVKLLLYDMRFIIDEYLECCFDDSMDNELLFTVLE